MKRKFLIASYSYLFVWTVFWIAKMWAFYNESFTIDITNNRNKDVPTDLPTNLTFIIGELAIILSFLQIEIDKKKIFVLGALFMFLTFVALGVYHAFALWHAGNINASMFAWWLGIFGFAILLICRGIFLRKFLKKSVVK